MTMIGLTPILDFQKLGVTSVDQCKVIYSSIIGSRIELGEERSSNEWKERLFQDSVGWTMWFYASDVIRKLYLAGAVFGNKENKEQLAGLLLSRKPKPILEVTPTVTQRLGHGLQVLNWHLNPGGRWAVPSSKQLEQRRNQLLNNLKTVVMEDAQKIQLKADLIQVFDKALSHNYMAMFLGITLNIALLGFGIPKLNIALTRLRNASKQQEQLLPVKPLNKQNAAIASPPASSPEPALPSALSQPKPFFAASANRYLPQQASALS
jgi:hypothetical protein